MPVVNSRVKFVTCTIQEYSQITPDQNTVYFATDSSVSGRNRLFVGAVEYCPPDPNVRRVFFYNSGTLDLTDQIGSSISSLVPDTPTLVPNTNIFVGDIVIDGAGSIFEISSFSGSNFIVSLLSGFYGISTSSYGVCSTSVGVTSKVVTTQTPYSPKVGTLLCVKFDNDVPAGSTLNVNGTGDSPIYYKGLALVANIIKSGDTVTFVYADSKYQIVSIDSYLTRTQAESLFVV